MFFPRVLAILRRRLGKGEFGEIAENGPKMAKNGVLSGIQFFAVRVQRNANVMMETYRGGPNACVCVFLRVLGSHGWGTGIAHGRVGSGKIVGSYCFCQSYVSGFEKIGSMIFFCKVGGCKYGCCKSMYQVSAFHKFFAAIFGRFGDFVSKIAFLSAKIVPK